VSATDHDPQDSPSRGCPGKGSRAALIYGGEPPPDEEESDACDDAIAYGTLDGEPAVPVGFREDVESLLGIDLEAFRRGS
jgi:hypothetical protein